MRLRFEKKFSVKEKSKYEYEPTGEREIEHKRGQIPEGKRKRSDGGCDGNNSIGSKSKNADKQNKEKVKKLAR